VTVQVRAFDELTPRGQVGRLRTVALDALRAYDLEVERCSFVRRAFNTVFRIDATSGSTYALRVSPSLRIHADGCEAAEAAWLAALRSDAGLAVSQVIPARAGSVVVWARAPGVPDGRSCVLFDWVRGRPLRERLNVARARQVGVLVALVHEHGSSYAGEPPAGVLIADRVLYFRGASRLDELRGRYGSLLDYAVGRAQQALDELWRNPPHRAHLLHGDLHAGNVMMHRNELVLMDFQDLIWGFEVQDLSIALLGLERLGDTGSWSTAFRSGYESVRPWPDAEPETRSALRAARHLNELDFSLNMRRPGLEQLIARHAEAITDWMTG